MIYLLLILTMYPTFFYQKVNGEFGEKSNKMGRPPLENVKLDENGNDSPYLIKIQMKRQKRPLV